MFDDLIVKQPGIARAIKVTEVDLSPEVKQVMALVSNGMSLVKAIRKIRGTREVELMPIGRRGFCER